jgi:hypothetical protein
MWDTVVVRENKSNAKQKKLAYKLRVFIGI